MFFPNRSKRNWYAEKQKRKGFILEGVTSVFQRYEKKYLLNEEAYQALRQAMAPYTEPDRFYRSSIVSLYFDTPDWLLTRRSEEKPIFKEKLRLRCYGVPETETPTFVEMKRKVKGTVYKRREVLPYEAADRFLTEDAAESPPGLVFRELKAFRQRYPGLAPAMVIAYDRESLAGTKQEGLRITFDHNLVWRTEDLDLRDGRDGQPLLEEGQRLMEIKVLGAMPLWLARALSETSIFPQSYSKIGTAFRAQRSTSFRHSREVLQHV